MNSPDMNGTLEQLARRLYPYGAVRTVLRGPVRKARYIVAPSMGASYALGLDVAHMAFLGRSVREGMTVYDIGANRGQFALFFSRAVGLSGRVVSFEPVPSVYETLVKNLALNEAANVTPLCVALADAKGTAPFAYTESRSTEGKLVDVEKTYEVPGASVRQVAIERLDALGDELPPPDIVKVDVEGAAAAVFRGARTVLERSRPKIYVELHGPEEQEGVRDELLSRGYRAESLAGEPVEDPTAEWVSPLWCVPREGA